jgi:archaemetzincin
MAEPLAEVAPLGPVEANALAVVAGHLQAIFELPALVAPPWPEPDYALIAHRRQYDAGLILGGLAQGRPPGRLRLGVTALDICLPIFTHVYGEARLGLGVGVVSLHRLARGLAEGARPPRALVYARLAKTALHEAGHALGLTHCQVPGCLMAFSQTMAQIDALEGGLCPACQADLAFRRRLLSSASTP